MRSMYDQTFRQRAIVASLAVIAPFGAFAQDLRVEYDKLTGRVEYFTAKQEADGTHYTAIKKPKLRSGETVELRVVNMNEFVFKARTTVRMRSDSASSEFGATFSSFLSSTSGFFTNMNIDGFDLNSTFDDIAEMLGGLFHGAGGEERTLLDETSTKEWMQLKTNADAVNRELEGLLSEAQQLAHAHERIRDLQFSRTGTLQEIKAARDSLRATLDKELLSAAHAKRSRTRFDDLMARARENAASQEQLFASVDDALVMRTLRNTRLDLDEAEKSYNAMDPEGAAREFERISKMIDQARFHHAETFALDDENISDLWMTVEVYDQTAWTQDASGVLAPGQVVFYYTDRFTTGDGQVQDGTCDSCRPLKRCQGFMLSEEEFDPLSADASDSTALPDMSMAYGVWSFWDRNGKLVREQHIRRPDLTGDMPSGTGSGLKPKLDDQQTIRLSVARGLLFSPSLGFAVSALLDPAKEYQAVPVSDSTTMIVSGDLSNAIPTVTSMFHFFWDGPSNTHLGGSVGLGVGLASVARLSLMMGPSLILGRKNRVAFNAGILATQVDRLKPFLPVDQEISNDLLPNSVDGFYAKQFDIGGYFGVSFTVGTRQ